MQILVEVPELLPFLPHYRPHGIAHYPCAGLPDFVALVRHQLGRGVRAAFPACPPRLPPSSLSGHNGDQFFHCLLALSRRRILHPLERQILSLCPAHGRDGGLHHPFARRLELYFPFHRRKARFEDA